MSDRKRYPVKGHAGIYYREARKGRQYIVRYKDENGQWRMMHVEGNLQAAIRKQDELKAKLRKGEAVAPQDATFAEVAEAWQAIAYPKLKDSTARKYSETLERYALPAFGTTPIQRVSVERVAKWIADMEAHGLRSNTILNAIKPANRVFAYALRKRMIPENPVKALSRDERPKQDQSERRVLSTEELRRLLDATHPNTRLALEVLAFTGLRAGELCGLNWEDVNLSEGYLHVRYTRDVLPSRETGGRTAPKTPGSVRKVFLAASLTKALREHRMASPRSQEGEPVFLTNDGPLNYWALHKAFKRACKRAGLTSEPVPTLHSLRHAYGSMLIADGAPLAYVCGQLGHADPSITARVYTHEFEQARHAERATAGLEARMAGL